MPFFTYRQNNSGGVWDKGAAKTVIVEADDAQAADARAIDAGVYFDGVDTDRDCSCCGDRWYRAWAGDLEPTVYGEPVVDAEGAIAVDASEAPLWIIYADGRKETCGFWHDAD